MAEQVNMPSGMGGLVRYFDEEASKFQITPTHVTVLVGILILIELLVRAF